MTCTFHSVRTSHSRGKHDLEVIKGKYLKKTRYRVLQQCTFIHRSLNCEIHLIIILWFGVFSGEAVASQGEVNQQETGNTPYTINPAEILKWNNPPSILWNCQLSIFSDNEMTTSSRSANSKESVVTAWICMLDWLYTGDQC